MDGLGLPKLDGGTPRCNQKLAEHNPEYESEAYKYEWQGLILISSQRHIITLPHSHLQTRKHHQKLSVHLHPLTSPTSSPQHYQRKLTQCTPSSFSPSPPSPQPSPPRVLRALPTPPPPSPSVAAASPATQPTTTAIGSAPTAPPVAPAISVASDSCAWMVAKPPWATTTGASARATGTMATRGRSSALMEVQERLA